MQGKTILITGAAQGIGKETARALAGLGANVVLVARDRERGEAAISDIKASSGNSAIELLIADLSSLAAVRHLAEEFSATHEHLHVLINNAGMKPPVKRTLTDEGLEVSLVVNYLAPFLLTNLLLDRLTASVPARIVNVSSNAHEGGTAKQLADLQGEASYNWLQRYAVEKLALVLFTYELARRLDGTGITANALHPGVVNTQIIQQFGDRFKLLMPLLGRFLLTPQQGAATSIYLASSPTVEGVTGKYFVKSKETRSARASYDLSLAQQLWETGEQLTGLHTIMNVSTDPTNIH
jgi:NAD(P)-dependent dehydrogenase (short-subunit alcohol dehydrogenase family)